MRGDLSSPTTKAERGCRPSWNALYSHKQDNAKKMNANKIDLTLYSLAPDEGKQDHVLGHPESDEAPDEPRSKIRPLPNQDQERDKQSQAGNLEQPISQ